MQAGQKTIKLRNRPGPSAVWRLHSVPHPSHVGAWSNVWDINLEGGPDRGPAGILKPLTLPCGFYTTAVHDKAILTWAQAGCSSTIRHSLSAFCKHTVRPDSSFVKEHFPTAHICARAMDGDPGTFTAFEAVRPKRGGVQHPLFRVQQIGAKQAYDRVFLYKSDMLSLDRQMSAFTIKCGTGWESSVNLGMHAAWTSKKVGWVAIPFPKPCSAEIIELVNMKSASTRQFYVLEIALGKTEADIHRQRIPKTRKVEGYCIHHQKLPPFSKAWAQNGPFRGTHIVAQFETDMAGVPCSAKVKVQLQLEKVMWTIRYLRRGRCGQCWAGIFQRDTPLRFAFKDSQGSEIMTRTLVVGAQQVCHDRCEECAMHTKGEGVSKQCVPHHGKAVGRCLDVKAHVRGNGHFKKPFQCAASNVDSQFTTMSSAEGQPVTLVNVVSNQENNAAFQYQVSGSMKVTYWSKFPDDVDCPLPE